MTKFARLAGLACGLGLFACAAFAAPQGTAWTYQGQLHSAGQPVSGPADFQFTLWDRADPSDPGGVLVADPIAVSAVDVLNGLFTVALDFGPDAFNGEARWLGIAVASPTGGPLTPLLPRQPLLATPSALHTRGLFVDADERISLGGDVGRARLNVLDGVTSYTGQLALVDPLDNSTATTSNAFISGWGAEFLTSNDDVGRLWLLGNLYNGDNNVYFINELNARMGLGTGGRSSDLTIDANGRVGIGTNTPAAKLEIAGTPYVDGLRLPDGSLLTTARNTMSPIARVRLANGIDLETAPTQLDASFLGTGPAVTTGNPIMWQSFTAGVTGELALAEVYRDNASDATVAIYAGDGTGGMLLASSYVPSLTGQGWQTIDALPQTVPIVAGQQYTIALTGSAVRWAARGDDQYPGGRSSIGTTHDQVFRTYVLTPGGTYQLALRASAENNSIGIGRTPVTNKLEVQGDASKSTAGAWLANSDRRIKTAIETIGGALEVLDQIRLVRFRYTDAYRAAHPEIADRRYLNVLAQEFAQVFPDFVKGSGEYLPDGAEILQVDTYPLTIYSAAAIQELHADTRARVAAVDARLAGQDAALAALRAENAALAARIAQLEQLLSERAAP